MKTILALTLVLAATAVVACRGDDDDSASPTLTPTPSITVVPTVLPTAEPTEAPTGTPVASVCPTNPDPADVTEVAIAAPHAGDNVMSPLSVQGVAASAGGEVQMRLLDSGANEIATGSATTEEAGTLSHFEDTIDFEVGAEEPGCLQVYVTAEDGGQMSVAQVPLLLAPLQ